MNLSYQKEGLNAEEYSAHLDDLDEKVCDFEHCVWASFTPAFAADDSLSRERLIEDSFALYLKFVDRHMKGRKNQIPRIVWRHWFSEEKEEYGYLHFHILYLLDGTEISTEQMIEVWQGPSFLDSYQLF